jgi:hypothetical protein
MLERELSVLEASDWISIGKDICSYRGWTHTRDDNLSSCLSEIFDVHGFAFGK